MASNLPNASSSGSENSTGIWQAKKTALLTALQRRKLQELETECLTQAAASSMSNWKPCPILCHDVGCSQKKKEVALQDKHSER